MLGSTFKIDGREYVSCKAAEPGFCTGCDLYKAQQGLPCRTEEMPCNFGEMLKAKG